MKPKTTIAVLLLLFFYQATVAQQLSKEATYEISKKANKGYLSEPKIDEAANLMTLNFITKSTTRKAKFETCKFDLNFNFLGIDDSERDVEKLKGYRVDKGDEWEMNAVSVEVNSTGTLVLRRKIIKKKWNWFWGGYDIKIEQKEKLKPKSDEGNGFYYLTHTEQNEHGSVIIIVGEKGDKNDPNRQYKKIHVLRYDADLNQIADKILEFDYPQMIAASNTYNSDEEAESDEDFAILFAPRGGSGYKKVADPNAGNYTYVSISTTAEIKERVTVASNHGIFDGTLIKIEKDMVIYGPANENKTDYLNEKPEDDKFKAKNFQIVRISNGKVSYVTSIPISDFEKKAQKTPIPKKITRLQGKEISC